MTGSKEDYIKAIYELGGEFKRISTKEIAENLKISPPSVSEMLRKLEEEDLLQYKVYRGVMLTAKGIYEALRIKKIHILWEVFLVDMLGYDVADVHEEAELLEHITSPKLAAKLDEYLDYPKVCPHGTPIYNERYLYDYLPLSKDHLNKRLMIKRFQDDKEFLNKISKLDLSIGDEISLNKLDEEYYWISVDNKEIKLSKLLGKNIFVEELS